MKLIKNKKFISVVLAVAFLLVVFLLKTQNEQSKEASNKLKEDLAYGELTVGDLLNKDTDGDGVLDWEESLYGTDLNKKDTNEDGILDNEEIAQIKTSGAEEENLTQTEKFSRELFATIVALNQAGEIDQDTVDQLSASLVEQIQNAPVRKVYLFSEIKVKKDDSQVAVEKYATDFGNLYKKYPIQGRVLDILEEFVNSGDQPDASILSELDPIIKQTNNFMGGMLKIEVPQSLVVSHLGTLNALERLVENLNDIKLFDSDPIVAMGAISQYEINADSLIKVTDSLRNLINKKLSS